MDRNPSAATPTRKLSRRRILRSGAAAASLTAIASLLPVAGAGCSQIGLAPKKKMTVWIIRSFAPPADEVLLGHVDKWGKEKGLDLEVVAEIEEPTLNQRLMAAVESKQLPDICEISGGRITLHYPAKVFEDVSALYAEIGKQYGGWFKVADQTATIDGKQWAIPFSIDSSLMHYRKDILDKKGLKIPETWDEYVETMKKAQEPPKTYGAGIALSKGATDCEGTFKLMMYSFGATWCDQTGQKITINSAETRKFLDFVANTMYKAGIFPPDAMSWDNASNNGAYQNETAITVHNPASILVWCLDNKPELGKNTAIAGLPKGPTGKSFNSAGVRVGWAIFNTTPKDKQDLAADWIKWVYQKEQYEPWIAKAFAAPPVAKYEQMEVWKDPQRAGFLEAAKTGIMGGYPGPLTPASAELDSRVPTISMILRVLVDKWSIDQAVEEAEKVAKDIYGKYYK